MSPANSQRQRKNKVQRPFHGKISAKGIKDLGEKPCTCRRLGNVQTHTGQVPMPETPEMFGLLTLDPNNDWIKLSKFVTWREFDLKYADNFRSKKGQRACDSRMALGSVLIKIHYKGMSDEDRAKEIAMNLYLQYFQTKTAGARKKTRGPRAIPHNSLAA